MNKYEKLKQMSEANILVAKYPVCIIYIQVR